MTGRINREPELKLLFDGLQKQITDLQNQRMTVPVVATDPTNPRKGDIWINSTTHLLKIKDDAGATRVITWT